MRTMVQCGRCKGSGKVPNLSIGAPPGATQMCPGCNGDGNVNVNTPATHCGQCRGSGFVPNTSIGAPPGATQTCPGCGGSGWAR
jgi:DnaJ-class molecular chaperone